MPGAFSPKQSLTIRIKTFLDNRALRVSKVLSISALQFCSIVWLCRAQVFRKKKKIYAQIVNVRSVFCGRDHVELVVMYNILDDLILSYYYACKSPIHLSLYPWCSTNIGKVILQHIIMLRMKKVPDLKVKDQKKEDAD